MRIKYVNDKLAGNFQFYKKHKIKPLTKYQKATNIKSSIEKCLLY